MSKALFIVTETECLTVALTPSLVTLQAIALGIKALPTFHIFKGGKKQAELTGAKAAQLRQLIESHM